ncbi:MAG: hypothetical protein ACUZ8I_18640 [Candidatus Scalindua sp.]
MKIANKKNTTAETVNNVVNKLYESLNPKDIISEQAGFGINRFLNAEKMKLLKERFGSAN